MPNLPSPSTRLYSTTAKSPESASVAVTRTMVVPRSTFSNTGSYQRRLVGALSFTYHSSILLQCVQFACYYSAQYLIRRLQKDGVVVIHIHYAQINWQLSYPGRSAMVLGSDREIQPLNLLEIHRLVGYDLTCKNLWMPFSQGCSNFFHRAPDLMK